MKIQTDHPNWIFLTGVRGAHIAEINKRRAPNAADTARRLAAAYNACEGIPTEALEQGVVEQMVEALKKGDDLWDMMPLDSGADIHDIAKEVRNAQQAVLALAEGEKK
jgi:hypothetical protein